MEQQIDAPTSSADEQKTAATRTSCTPGIPAPPVPAAVQYPVWWRSSWVPFVVLLLAAVAGDLLAPRFTVFFDGEVALGLGAAVGGVVLMAAVLLLRRDMSRGERWYMGSLAVSCSAALAVSGSLLCWLMVFLLPLFYLALVRTNRRVWDAKLRYFNWWSFWVAAPRAHRLSFLTRVLPWLISCLAGAVFFVLFLCIFASGNPVVEIVWQYITDTWNRLIYFLRIDWDFGVHVLLWLLGMVAFGLYTQRRPQPVDAAVVAPKPVVSAGRSLLPQLPLMMLLGINMAFIIVNASDMAYLWFRRVPEGVSQTQYLHEGADSIIWASIIASAILIFLFRSTGNARRGVLSRGLGYLLVGQTMLLAGSVFLRLYYQIDDFGFTVRRLVAGEMMLFGVLGLVVLLDYMVSGKFLRSLLRGVSAAMVLLALTQVNPPSSLAGDLNMRYGASLVDAISEPSYVSSSRRWSFAPSDFRSRVPMAHNLTFALYVYDRSKDSLTPEERRSFLADMIRVAYNVEKRASQEGWFCWNWLTQRDIPAAERILGRPIVAHPVDSGH